MKLSDLHPGMLVVTDTGFTCLDAGVHEVQSGQDGALYIDCRAGKHYLDGQVDHKTGELIGITHCETV